nr:putative ribonuclease H-like domain-containing protein [Tanacetum cinerariifolium]
MRIKQYIKMMDYALWEVIENGTTLPKSQVMEGVTIAMPITSVEDKAQRNAKQLLEAIEKRFGGNAATNKTQRNLLKRQFENFYASSLEMLDQTFDRLQKNKANLDTMSLDDLYNNFKVYELEVKGMSSSNSNTQNMAFLSSINSSTNGVVNTAQAVNTANKVSTASTQVNIVDKLSDAVICLFLASQPNMDYNNCQKRGHVARECRDLRNQGTKHKESTIRIVPMETLALTALVSCDGLGGYDWSDQAEKGPNYALVTYTSLSSDSKNEFIYLEDIKVLKVEIQMKDITIKEIRKKLEVAQKEKDRIMLTVENLKNAYKHLNKLIDCQIVDNYKKGLWCESYNAVSPPYIGYFMPPKPNLSYTGLDEFAIKTVVENKSSEEETKAVRKNVDALIIKEWVSGDEKENGNPYIDLQDKGVIDSGCSRNMTGNMSYLIYYEEIDRGYVAFGGNPKGGKITGKCTIKTVVIDDFSRFTWVFFLATKDETSGILKSFITRIENLVDHKVKVIRCDNGTEFKIRELNQFCKMKGSGPDWLFDIDALKRTMNYEPIVVGTQSNNYPVMMERRLMKIPSKGNECNDQEKEDNVNSTNNVNDVSLIVNAAGINNDNELPFDLNMPTLEYVGTFDLLNKDEDDGEMADMNNLDTTIQFIPTLRLQVKQKNDGIFISQDKYVAEILKKFGFIEVKNASTPMETQKPLLKDKDGEEVDVHMYLKGKPKLGLWYLKDSPFDLVAYTESDYAGASLDKKSTTGG